MMIYIKGSPTKPNAWDNRLYRKERGEKQRWLQKNGTWQYKIKLMNG
jgi:hypothetical protein